MSDGRFFFNGVDGASGKYLLGPMDARRLAEIGSRIREPFNFLDWLKTWVSGRDVDDPSRAFDGDTRDLSQTGWGVIYAPGMRHKVRSKLSALLEHRRDQVGRSSSYFKEYDYEPGETASQFLSRNGAKPGMTAIPARVPYYLLLVGDPEEIPFSFQCELDVTYAVGRLSFQTVQEYEAYASNVEKLETGRRTVRLPHRVSCFGVKNPGDPSTRMTSEELVKPLLQAMKEPGDAWEVKPYLEREATKDTLRQLLGGPETPSLLFTASHGVGFPLGDKRQLQRQGALICGEWGGPEDEEGVSQDHYFTADDLLEDPRLHGLVAFLFACYSAGTPARDGFDQKSMAKARRIAPHPFVSSLPQKLLASGALAVVGHVDRAWTTSFEGSSRGEGPDIFRGAFRRLLAGHTVGWAMEYFNQAHAALASELAQLWQAERFWEEVDPEHFAALWMANNDARNFVVLGDPAVKLAPFL